MIRLGRAGAELLGCLRVRQVDGQFLTRVPGRRTLHPGRA